MEDGVYGDLIMILRNFHILTTEGFLGPPDYEVTSGGAQPTGGYIGVGGGGYRGDLLRNILEPESDSAGFLRLWGLFIRSTVCGVSVGTCCS